MGGSSDDTSSIGEYSLIQGRTFSRFAMSWSNSSARERPFEAKPNACPPYTAFGIHSRNSLGSRELCAPVTAAQVSLEDSRETASLLLGSAMSLCRASHNEVQAPAEPPVEPTRLGSTFHSLALERMVCRARAAS